MNLSEEINAPQSASDEAIDAWRDAILVADMISNALVFRRLDYFGRLPVEGQLIVQAATDAEWDRRFNVKTDAMVAHTIEQGEAAEQDGNLKDRRRLLAYRAARLCKLIELQAPDVIIDAALDLVAKS